MRGVTVPRAGTNTLSVAEFVADRTVTGTSVPAYPAFEIVTDTSQFPDCTAFGNILSTARSGNP
jgi:hypothetical protein